MENILIISIIFTLATFSTFTAITKGENLIMLIGYSLSTTFSTFQFGLNIGALVGIIFTIIFFLIIIYLKKTDNKINNIKTDSNLDQMQIGILTNGRVEFRKKRYIIKDAKKYNLEVGMKVKVLNINGAYATIQPLQTVL